jgi:hypothetical protein
VLCAPVNDTLRIALIAIVAVIVARKVLPMIPGAGPIASLL